MLPFCQYRFFRLAGEGEMDHEAIEVVGRDKLWVQGAMNIKLCSV
jgi:hypothetical protein